MRSYDMGCDCGKQKETLAEKTACQKSALLEAPDQVSIILVIIDWHKICEQRVKDKDKRKKDMRIVGGCDAGHVPWYVFLDINGGCQNINSKNLTHKNSLGSPQVFSGNAFGW